MRVLWFTNTPSNYLQGTNAYNGGGWISSLESELRKHKDVNLGIAFLLDGHPEKVEREDVVYYPIHHKFKGILERLKEKLFPKNQREFYYINEYLKVINDFKPDIINIFGTEGN